MPLEKLVKKLKVKIVFCHQSAIGVEASPRKYHIETPIDEESSIIHNQIRCSFWLTFSIHTSCVTFKI
jgi:hypothetical protein